MASKVIPSAAERKLIEAAASGETADYRTPETIDDPRTGGSWDEARTLRAAVIRALILRIEPEWRIAGARLRIVGARITGSLDLSGAELLHALAFERCHLEEPIKLSGGKFRSFYLCSSDVAEIDAREMECGGDVAFDGTFNARGRIVLAGARIDGDLLCGGGTFTNTIDARGIEVSGSVILSDGCKVQGAVILSGARIGGDLSCSCGIFQNPGATAIERR